MRFLLVEDDFVVRTVMQNILKEYGSCDIAVNGQEAVEAVKISTETGDLYNLICLDIMMPKMDGQEALKQIRKIETDIGLKGCKIVMTTALDDSKSIIKAFHEQCDGYLTKPISKETLKEKLIELKLIN